MEKKKSFLNRIFVILAVFSLCCSLFFAVPSSATTNLPDPAAPKYLDFPLLFDGLNYDTDVFMSGLALPIYVDSSLLSSNNSLIVDYNDTTFCEFNNFSVYNASQISYDIVPLGTGFEMQRDGRLIFTLAAPVFKAATLQQLSITLDDDFVVSGSYSGYKAVTYEDQDGFSLSWQLVTSTFEESFQRGDFFTFSLQTLTDSVDVLTQLTLEITPHATICEGIRVRSTFSTSPSRGASAFVDRLRLDVAKSVYFTELPTNWLDWLIDVCSGFLNLEFVPGFSLGYMLAAILGVLVIWWLLHLFM